MFNFDTGLARRNGPLAKVWLASHMGDRKLSKAQLLGTSIPKSVGAIIGSEQLPLALRLSGQLLLGVARIYSRKVKYLVDDCNDALLKIKMTFRLGATVAVDLPAEQAQASKASITRQDQQINEFDALYQDVELDLWTPEVYHPKATPGKSVAIANDADITRQEDGDDDFYMPRIEFADELFGYARGDAIELQPLGVDLTSSARKRQRQNDDTEEDISIEYGRDAVHHSARLSNRMSYGAPSSEADQTFMDDSGGGGEGFGLDLDFAPMPDRTLSSMADFDLSGAFEAHDKEMAARQATPATELNGASDGQRTPRATSPTGEGALETNENEERDLDVTPRTAKRVADTAALNSAKKRKTAAKPRIGKQIVDASTELVGSQKGRRGPLGTQSIGGGSRATDPSLLVDPQYLPASRTALRMFEINRDPALYYLSRVLPKGKLYAGPPELVPELAELFEITNFAAGPPTKRARRSVAEADVSVELGRRAENGRLSDRLSVGDGNQTLEDDWDPSTLMSGGGYGGDGNEGENSLQLDYAPRDKSITPAPPPSRGFTPLPPDAFSTPMKKREPGEGMLGVFDVAPPSTQSSQRIQSQSQTQDEDRQAAASGWSKNTVRALRVLNEELGPAPAHGKELDEKELSFEEAADQASRPAAAAFFFELLVLGSRGCVDIQQAVPYGDISISAKPKLWDVVGRSKSGLRNSSMPPPESTPVRTPIAGR